MIIKRSFFGIKSVRVMLGNDEYTEIDKIVNSNSYDLVTVVSFIPLDIIRRDFKVKEKKVANIKLDRTIDEIFKKFNESTRNEINKTYRNEDLKFVVGGEIDSGEEFLLYSKFEKAQGRKPWNKHTFNNLVNAGAFYKKELVVAMPCYPMKPVLQIRAIFSKRLEMSDREIKKIISNASRRLVLEMCKYGQNNGYKFVGLGEVTETTSQKINVANFKKYFNPDIVTQYTYTYMSKRLKLLIWLRDFIHF